MQFHLNGFQPGDPLVAPAHKSVTHSENLPTEVDVLIVGSGPAGLTLAAQLSQFPELRVAVVEQKPERLKLGQADGIACRTMEMFEAFNFSDRIMREDFQWRVAKFPEYFQLVAKIKSRCATDCATQLRSNSR